ncbi:DNA repair exonuclease [Hyphopichia burtonii NRRL Y-1933]|uniref:Double-strand break repair protein n=1 Tax=Hyphopichia burtonii NRRL Y-1933 TaxID=984485 RepID=A0A1E4RRC8_9ASCO|nr:DNA repair exonuclease [Hyphopichia burtonii NRRL Y-1933]ODV69615.1 DNA repair exonuclease [Hyphopichia burtonii NRRL Y-1933]
MPPIQNIEEGPDTIRILITTDNHVGYNENDLIRGDDGWKTFQEITYLAKTKDVDMILQSGDLFHVNKPSKKSIYHVMRSLRLNCLGDRPCELELLSDPSNLLDGGFNTVNYEDPNINVSVPVFAISGNHDDATGEGLLLPLDLLSVSGFINYFGKIPDNEKITVMPILLQKGKSKLALYGMNNVKDERLHRNFRDGEVTFLRPNVQTDQWFNLLALHQNHYQHSATSFLPESYLPSFLNFVLWGHEHECIPNPVYNPDTGFDTLQPGSSIATALSEGETAEKHVFILSIKEKEYSLEPIKLQTVRPFVMKEVSLMREGFVPGPASKNDISKFLVSEVEKLIEEANQQYRDSNPELFEDLEDDIQPEYPLPLVRLRVEYSGDYEVENARRFSNKFVGKIANVNDVLHCYKKKGNKYNQVSLIVLNDKKLGIDERDLAASVISKANIKDFLKDFLEESNMSIIPEEGIIDMTKKCIDQDDKQLISDYIENSIESSIKLLSKVDINFDDLEGDGDSRLAFKNVLNTFKREHDFKKLIDKEASKRLMPYNSKKSDELMEIDNEESGDTQAGKKTQTKARLSTRSTASKRKAAPKSSMAVDDHDDDSDHDAYQEDDSQVEVNEIDSEQDEEYEVPKKKQSTRKPTTKGTSRNLTSKTANGRNSKKTTESTCKRNVKKPQGSIIDDIMKLGR